MMRPSLIEKFLDLPGESVSPFDLLGVAPEACTASRVREALARRLARLERRPEAFSHEADEVRLALFAAAAQLLDPAVRAALTASDAAPTGPASPAKADTFDLAAAHVLAMAGGFNAKSQRWLALLAHAHGLSERDVRERLLRLGRARGTRRPAPGGDTAATTENRATATRATSRPMRRRRPGLSVGAVISIATVTTLIALMVGAMALRETAQSVGRVDDAGVDSRGSAAPTPGPRQPDGGARSASAPAPLGAQADQVSPASVERWLERAHEDVEQDPGQAVWRFDRAVEALARGWVDLGIDERARVDSLVRGMMHRVDPSAASGRRALASIASGVQALSQGTEPAVAPSVNAAVWSAATLAILASDGDASGAVRRWSRNAWRSWLGGDPPPARGLDDAVLASAPAVATVLIDRLGSAPAGSAGGLDAWVHCVRRVSLGADALVLRDRTVLTAAEILLTSPGRVAVDARAHAALVALLSSLRWTAEPGSGVPPARRTVLAWFDEPAIRTADLAVVTEWLVESSGAPGLDPTMTLSRGSIPESRVALRERYARAWGLEATAGAQGFAVVWSRAAREALASVPTGSPAAALARVAVAARLRAAAAARWRGDSNSASALLMDPLSAALQAQRPVPVHRGTVRHADERNDGSWALRFLSVRQRDGEARARLLAELGRRPGALGPIDAGVLAQAALRSPTGEVRDRAAQVVRRRAGEAGVVVAVLNALSDASRSDATTALVRAVAGAALPGPSDPSWPFILRRALIDRALATLAPTDEAAVIDSLEAVIARAYGAALPGEDIPTAPGDSFGAERAPSAEGPAPVAAESARRLAAQWRDEAERLAPNPRAPMPIEMIQRRAAARLALAKGPAERFVASQRSIADALAYVVSVERPSRASAVGRVLRELGAAQRHAASLPEQAQMNEMALLRLWAIRLGVDPDAPVPTELISTPPTPVDGQRPPPQSLGEALLRSVGRARLEAPVAAPIRDRLESIDAGSPRAVFELAEDATLLSSVTGDRAWRDAARRLFLRAYALGEHADEPDPFAASVCLALADLSSRVDEQRWLRALARSLDPAIPASVVGPGVVGPDADAEARLALAQTLEFVRLGDNRDAARRLATPGAEALLDRYGPMIEGGAAGLRTLIASQPACRQCRNERVVPDPSDPGGPPRLCPTCGGEPGPKLSDAALIAHLRLERVLVSADPAAWSAALAVTAGAPVRDVDPATLLEPRP